MLVKANPTKKSVEVEPLSISTKGTALYSAAAFADYRLMLTKHSYLNRLFGKHCVTLAVLGSALKSSFLVHWTVECGQILFATRIILKSAFF